jgi:hypothetical protein
MKAMAACLTIWLALMVWPLDAWAKPCPALPKQPSSFGELHDAFRAAKAAMAQIDFGKTAVSYSEGAELTRQIDRARQFVDLGEQFVKKAEAEPSLLFYWHVYTGATSARDDLVWVASLMPITHKDEKTAEQAGAWRDSLQDAAEKIDAARTAVAATIDQVLQSADECAFGVKYGKRSTRQ